MVSEISKEKALELLAEVADPEIPVLSLIDLGMISDVLITDKITVKLTPTFVGCPAINYLKNNIVQKFAANHFVAEVEIDFSTPWTTDKISEEGRAKLKKFGIAPPEAKSCFKLSMENFKNIKCPYCDSTNTTLKSTFGSTLCRAMHYCNNCKQAFEQFKPVG